MCRAYKPKLPKRRLLALRVEEGRRSRSAIACGTCGQGNASRFLPDFFWSALKRADSDLALNCPKEAIYAHELGHQTVIFQCIRAMRFATRSVGGFNFDTIFPPSTRAMLGVPRGKKGGVGQLERFEVSAMQEKILLREKLIKTAVPPKML